MNTSKILSIYTENLKVAICTFDGNKYEVFSLFYDNFSLTKSLKWIEDFKPTKIIASVSVIFQETLNSLFKNDIVYIQVKSKPFNIIQSINKIENTVIKMLSVYLNHSPITNIENPNIIGYVGEYPLTKIDLNGFYLDEYINTNILDFKKLTMLIKGTITSFGRHTMLQWIIHPLINPEDIIKRRTVINNIACNIPRLIKLLKKCKTNCFNKKISFFKLKILIKSTLIISKLLKDKITLENKKRYIKLYKILRIFNKDGILKGKNKRYDDLKDLISRLPNILETTAKKLSTKYMNPISIVYFPGSGFYIEEYYPVNNYEFSIKDSFYIKNEEMKRLDAKFGDPYEQLNAIETSISIKVIEKIQKIKLADIYDFLGNIDGYVALYMYTEGINVNITENMSYFKYKDMYFHGKSLFLTQINMIELIEMIVINQIGGKIDHSSIEFPIFDKLLFKLQSSEKTSNFNGMFQNEILQLSKIYKKTNDKTLCIFDKIAEATNPQEGIMIFSSFIKLISPKMIIVHSNYEISDLTKDHRFSKFKIYQILNGNQQIVDGTNKIEDEENELCEMFKEYNKYIENYNQYNK